MPRHRRDDAIGNYIPRFARDQTLSIPSPPFKSKLPLPGEYSPGGGDFAPRVPNAPRKGQGSVRKQAVRKRNATGLNKQVALQRRGVQGHRLRGRSGLSYALKTEYERNECDQTIFHVKKLPDSNILQLNFVRRNTLNQIEVQPFTYEVEISVAEFKKLMDTATFANMGIWFAKIRPGTNVKTALRAMQNSRGGSRAFVGENARMRRHIFSLHKDMQKSKHMNERKKFQLMCDDDAPARGNAMSTSTATWQPYADLNVGFNL